MINIKYKMIHHIHIKTLVTAWLGHRISTIQTSKSVKYRAGFVGKFH
jgi:hypothetical protein